MKLTTTSTSATSESLTTMCGGHEAAIKQPDTVGDQICRVDRERNQEDSEFR